MSAKPPRTLQLSFCPKCGRHDRFQPFTGRAHYSGGEKCTGTPVTVTYVLSTQGGEE